MFNKINLSTWERREHYNHFMNNLRCNYSMTVNIDITKLLEYVHKENFRLYPAIIHICSSVINSHYEFRMAKDSDGTLGYFDNSHPSYTVFNDETKTFSGIWTAAESKFATFYKNFLQDVSQYSSTIKYAPKDNQPQNTYYISCLPWTSFTALNVQIHDDGATLTPRFTIGKYFEDQGKILLPFSAEFHHAVCDGYHASLFFNHVQTLANLPETILQ